MAFNQQFANTDPSYVDPTLASYLTKKPQASAFGTQPVSSPGPVAASPFDGTTTQGAGDPSKGGFIVPPGSLPPPVVTQPGQVSPGQTDSSFGQYASDPVMQAIQTALQQGLKGDTLVAFVKQRNPNAEVSTGRDSTQIYYGTGGSNGYQIDMNAQGVWGVHPYSDGGTAGGGGGAGGGGSFSPSPAVDLTGAINSANMQSSPYAPQAQSFLDLLLGRANESLQVNPQDPIVKAQTDAYAASGERQLRNYLSSAAEKAGPGGNIDAVTRSANENLAQADASFTGQVLQNELTARRGEVAQALSLYGSTLTSQQQMALQEELAKLDAQLAQAQLQQGAYQFDASRQDRLAGF
jgi:hypothetical protein